MLRGTNGLVGRQAASRQDGTETSWRKTEYSFSCLVCLLCIGRTVVVTGAWDNTGTASGELERVEAEVCVFLHGPPIWAKLQGECAIRGGEGLRLSAHCKGRLETNRVCYRLVAWPWLWRGGPVCQSRHLGMSRCFLVFAARNTGPALPVLILATPLAHNQESPPP